MLMSREMQVLVSRHVLRNAHELNANATRTFRVKTIRNYLPPVVWSTADHRLATVCSCSAKTGRIRSDALDLSEEQPSVSMKTQNSFSPTQRYKLITNMCAKAITPNLHAKFWRDN